MPTTRRAAISLRHPVWRRTSRTSADRPMPCLRLSTALAIDPISDYQQRIWIALPQSSFIRRRHLFHTPTLPLERSRHTSDRTTPIAQRRSTQEYPSMEVSSPSRHLYSYLHTPPGPNPQVMDHRRPPRPVARSPPG